MVLNFDVQNQVVDILNGMETDNNISQVSKEDYVVIRINADADISITDGNEILSNIEGKESSEADFGSMYVLDENDDIVIFAISADESCDIGINTFDSNHMDYDIRFFNS